MVQVCSVCSNSEGRTSKTVFDYSVRSRSPCFKMIDMNLCFHQEKHENTVTKLSELRKDDKFQIHLMTTEINTWKLSSLVSSAFLL